MEAQGSGRRVTLIDHPAIALAGDGDGGGRAVDRGQPAVEDQEVGAANALMARSSGRARARARRCAVIEGSRKAAREAGQMPAGRG